MTRVRFNTTPAEFIAIGKIVTRASKLFPKLDQLSLRIDLAATNANGTPLDFDRLLAADDFNFMHDVSGIIAHMNRTTGKLDNMFRPRFTRRAS